MAFAVTEPVAELATTTNATSYALGAFTPAANSVLAVLVFATNTIASGTMTGGGLTWTQRTSQLYNLLHTAYLFTASVGASPSSTTITFDCTGDAASGCVMMAFQVTDADTIVPVRQVQPGSGALGNPSVTFPTTLLTVNAYIAGFGIPRNPPASTPPASWTEVADTGYGTPTSGATGAYRATGETGTTVTFTSALGNWGMIAVEINIREHGNLSQTLGAVTLSSASAVKVAGALSQTLGAAALSSAGSVKIVALLSQTLEIATLSSSGAVFVLGSATPTLDALSVVASGAVRISGSLDANLSSLVIAADGQVSLSGDAFISLDVISISSSGGVLVAGDLTVTLGDAVVNADGSVTITAESSIILEILGLVSDGAVNIFGDLSIGLGSLSILSAGSAIVSQPPVVSIPSGGGRQAGPFQTPTVVQLRPDVLDRLEARRIMRLIEEDEEILVILD